MGYETADVDTKPDFRLRLDANETREQSEGNQGLLLAPGDAVLLCSDGLWAAVEEDELNAVITRASAPQLAVDELIALALQRGVPDNITAVILQVPSAP